MTIAAPVRLIGSLPCFAGLRPEAMESLLNSAKEQQYAKGQIIMLEGEPCPGLFILASGAVKLYRSSTEGREQIVGMLRDGGCFECASLFDRGPNPVSAQALEATRLYFVPRTEFQSAVADHPEIVTHIVPVLAMRLRSLLDLVEDFSFRPVPARLAKLLLQFSGETEKASETLLPGRFNQQHLACILGCSRQSVNGALRNLVKQGIVKTEGRRIVVLKPEALRNQIQF